MAMCAVRIACLHACIQPPLLPIIITCARPVTRALAAKAARAAMAGPDTGMLPTHCYCCLPPTQPGREAPYLQLDQQLGVAGAAPRPLRPVRGPEQAPEQMLAAAQQRSSSRGAGQAQGGGSLQQASGSGAKGQLQQLARDGGCMFAAGSRAG